MITIEDVKEIPAWAWLETSAAEFSLVALEQKKSMLSMSFPIKTISVNGSSFAVVGLFRQSLLEIPHVWALFSSEASDLPPSAFRELRKIFAQYPDKMSTYIDETNVQAKKLAEFFGFHPTGVLVMLENRPNEIYRRP